MHRKRLSALAAAARSVGFGYLRHIFKTAAVKQSGGQFNDPHITSCPHKARLKALQGSAVCCISLTRYGVDRSTLSLPRTTLSAEMKVPFRDLRLVDPGLQDHNPTVIARKGAILLRLGQLSAVLKHNQVWLFEPHRDEVSEVAGTIIALANHTHTQDIHTHTHTHTDTSAHTQDIPKHTGYTHTQDTHTHTQKIQHVSYGRKSNQRKEIRVAKTGDTHTHTHAPSHDTYQFTTNAMIGWPFEFMCLEVCVQAALDLYEEKITRLEEIVNAKLEEHTQATDVSALSLNNLMAVMKLKNDLHNIAGLMHALRVSILHVLKEDEDMALMYLTEAHSGRRRSKEDHSEVEIMFEDYLQRLEELCSDATALQQQIGNQEDLTRLHLDARRNEFMEINVRISLMSMTCAAAAVISGAFGMNLTSHLEEQPSAFWMISLILGVVATSGLIRSPIFFNYFRISPK